MRVTSAHVVGIRRRPTALLASGSLAVVAGFGALAGDQVGPVACDAPAPAAVTGPAAVYAAALDEADRMVALVHAPTGSRAIAKDPSGGGPVWVAAGSNQLNRSRSWKLPMSFDDARAWLKSYNPPAFARHGLMMENASDSTGRATGPGDYNVADRTYGDLHRGHWSNALLNVSVSRGSGGSAYLNAFGLVHPLDDHPRRDTGPCTRMRVLVDQPCPDAPATERGFPQPGVKNPGQPDLDQVLVPAGTPTGGRICFYGNEFTASAQRVLDGPAAARIARAARQVHLEHDDYDGPHTGLGNNIPGMVVLALAYPGRPDVDVEANSMNGIGYVANGHVEMDGSPFGDSGFTCLLTRATPHVPAEAADGCRAPTAGDR